MGLSQRSGNQPQQALDQVREGLVSQERTASERKLVNALEVIAWGEKKAVVKLYQKYPFPNVIRSIQLIGN